MPFFGEDVEADALRKIVYDTLSFDCPVVKVEENIYALELFHGPTLAFKDVGARFMARLLQYFINKQQGGSKEPGVEVNVLVATSGDTGSAVANGFLGVEGIHVYVLYPKGKVSHIQESQFTTLGRNITAIEVDGVFDDCQRLVKSAFMDEELNRHMRLTSANSINVARFLPQAFYYFNAVARMSAISHQTSNIVMCVPSGNFGNICSALFGHTMGLPISRFIAANNANDVFYQYLQTGQYNPKPSVQTLANAMDVGDPSNFARILNLYSRNDHCRRTHQRITGSSAVALTADEQIRETMRQCYADNWLRKLIVMTKSTFFVEEDKILSSLFEEGLENLHLYKPDSEPMYSERLLTLLSDDYYKKITVHDHFYLKEEYRLRGIHLKTAHDRGAGWLQGQRQPHLPRLDELKETKKRSNYVFLKTLFDSQSNKNDKATLTIDELKEASRQGLIDKKVYAMGGMNLDNIHIAKELGFGGVVICGDLWNRFDIHNERTTRS